ncbi:uncharacterized protein JCM6883_002124 [Sporobolomyces salmoneus]|uniref:uncharacterized protein n=1 Tax=Sporobolomyces salmoneus TaxID=183962 RepID=UPI003174B292
MDLSKGGLVATPRPKNSKSKSKANSLESKSLSSSHSIPPRSRSFEEAQKEKGKRKKGASAPGEEEEELDESVSSNLKKTRYDNAPQAVYSAAPTSSRAPVSHTRSTSQEAEGLMVPPPSSQFRSNRLQTFSTATRSSATTREVVEEGGYIASQSFEHGSQGERGNVEAGNAKKNPMYKAQKEEFAPVDEEEEEEIQEEADDGGEGGGSWRTPRFKASNGENHRFSRSERFASTRSETMKESTPENEYDQAQLSSPPSSEQAAPEATANVEAEESTEGQAASPSQEPKPSQTDSNVDSLNPIPSLFTGPNPFLQHAKALAHSKGMVIEKTEEGTKAEEVVERMKREKVEFAKRFESILEKTQALFEGSLARQNELVAKLETHSAELAKEDEQVKGTEERLTIWSGQLLQEGKGEGIA